MATQTTKDTQEKQAPTQQPTASKERPAPSGGLAAQPRRLEPLQPGSLLRPFAASWMSRVRDEFDRLLDYFAWPGPAAVGNGWRWGLDVEDRDDAVVVRAEAPGFEPGDFEVSVEDHRLILRATHKATEKQEGGRREWQRECYEAVSLPAGIDKDKVEARYRNGVLTVTLPRTEQSKARHVPVKG